MGQKLGSRASCVLKVPLSSSSISLINSLIFIGENDENISINSFGWAMLIITNDMIADKTVAKDAPFTPKVLIK